MKRKEPVITQNELSAAIEKAVREAREIARGVLVDNRPGDDAITIQEYADGPPPMGRSTARDQLNKAIAAGKMEKIYAVVANKEGKPVRMQFYRKVKR